MNNHKLEFIIEMGGIEALSPNELEQAIKEGL